MYTLLPLPYDYSALEPYIDAETMKIHHDKHHQAYVDNLNKFLEGHEDLQKMPGMELLENLDKVPGDIRTKVKNNLGGVLNHNFFWQIMAAPKSKILPRRQAGKSQNSKITDEIVEQFNSAALGIFGSGWCWLTRDLKIVTTPNQDVPDQTPILGLDVWEHAYYLKYQNRRKDYIEAWWNVVNWEEVERRFNLQGDPLQKVDKQSNLRPWPLEIP